MGDANNRRWEVVSKPEANRPSRVARRAGVPAIVERAQAGDAFTEFFLARYDNPHTRRAYARHVRRFLEHCDGHGLELSSITPSDCAHFRDTYPGGVDQKKQMLSALRQFFDFMVERHFCLLNPASSARAPRQTVSEGKTPELPPRDLARLFATIDTSSLVGLRDRAVLAVMAATGCRVGAVARLKLKSFFFHDGQWHVRLDEKNSHERIVPVRYDLQRFMLEYRDAAGLATAPPDEPVFRTAIGRTGKLRAYEPPVTHPDGSLIFSARGAMNANEMAKMLKRRLHDAGLPGHYSPHSFRVTVATDLLDQDEDLADVQYLLGHTSPRTTLLYDRNKRRVTRNLVDRIRVNLNDSGDC